MHENPSKEITKEVAKETKKETAKEITKERIESQYTAILQHTDACLDAAAYHNMQDDIQHDAKEYAAELKESLKGLRKDIKTYRKTMHSREFCSKKYYSKILATIDRTTDSVEDCIGHCEDFVQPKNTRDQDSKEHNKKIARTLEEKLTFAKQQTEKTAGIIQVDHEIIDALRSYKSRRISHTELRTGDIIAQIPSPIDLGAYLQHKILSAIKDSQIAHLLMILKEGEQGKEKINFVDIIGTGMRYKEFTPKKGSIYIVLRPEVTPEQQAIMIKQAHNIMKSHPRYSVPEHLMSYIPYVLCKAFPSLEQHIKNPINDGRKYFCGELVDRICKEAKLYLTPEHKPGNMVLTTDVLLSPFLRFSGLIYNDSEPTHRLLVKMAENPQI